MAVRRSPPSARQRGRRTRRSLPSPGRPRPSPWFLALHQRGLFSWSEWAQALSDEVKRPGVAADGSDYYDCWLRALETLLAAKGIAGNSEVNALAAAWQRAAHATPHGKAILLENDPELSSDPR